jgi:signal transduction histidine kinase/CheY-like chemotaxis protein
MAIAGWFRRLVDRIARIPAHGSDPLVARRARLIAGFALIVIPFPVLSAVLEILVLPTRQSSHAVPVAVGSLLLLALCLALVRFGRIQTAGNLGSLLALSSICFGAWHSGGIESASLVWMPAVPVIAAIFTGRGPALGWAAASLVSIAMLGWLDAAGWARPTPLPDSWTQLYVIGVALVLALQFLLVRLYEQESEEAVAELVRIGELAQEASRAKSAFLANTSHEIRTPLTAIAGYADLLLDEVDRGDGSARHVEMVQTIRRNADHLCRVLGDVLDLSRIEAGRLEVEAQRVALPELLRDVTDLMSVQANLKGLALSLELAPDTPASVNADATRLRQVLVNLLGNAIRFTERGGVQLAAGRAGPHRLSLEVIDTGPGLRPDQIARIFEPFVQGDSSTTRTHGGTGLGLTISAALVELMGGSLDVHSTPGAGSCFRVELPIGDAPDAAAPPELSTAAPALPRPGLSVLVAEDGIDNQRLIRALLERLACRVEIAPNGERAVERLRDGAKEFDVVLLDMQMPVMDGYETARELRRQGVELPIVALTAHALSDDRGRCLAAGCSDYLSKPIDRAALAAALARAQQE